MESLEKPTKSKFMLYGMPRLSTSIVLMIIDFVILNLYIEVYAIPGILGGIATMTGKLSIAASQFLIGWLSDKTKTKYGRRKPYMFLWAPVVMFSFIFALLPTVFMENPGVMSIFIWILIWDAAFQFSYGALTTPYQSWVAEQFEVQDRSQASAFQNLFGFLGTGIGVVFTFLVIPPFIDNFIATRTIDLSFTLILVLIGALVVVLYYICAFILPVEKIEGAQMHFIEDVKEIIKDTNFMRVCLLQGIAFLAWGMVTPTLFGFVTDVLNFSGTNLYIAAGVLFLSVITFLFTWKKLIDIKGKKTTISIIFLAAVVILPFSLIVLLPGEIPFLIAILYILGVAACLGGWYLFPYIWYADLAEDAERRSGSTGRKAGLYAGFPNILLNIFQAIALLITGPLLADTPLIEGKTYTWGYALWGVWCSAVLLVGYIYIKKYIQLDFDWEKEPRT